MKITHLFTATLFVLGSSWAQAFDGPIHQAELRVLKIEAQEREKNSQKAAIAATRRPQDAEPQQQKSSVEKETVDRTQ